MNIAHNRISAAAGAPDQGVSLLRRVAACLSVSLALGMACAGSVQAADNERDQQRQEQRYPSQRSERAAQQREDVRQFNPRSFEQRAEEQRRELQQQRDNSQQDNRRPGRLTPDERRDLRRQINEAGMDLYPNTPRR